MSAKVAFGLLIALRNAANPPGDMKMPPDHHVGAGVELRVRTPVVILNSYT